MVAAAISFNHFFCTKGITTQELNKNGHRILITISCQGRDPIDSNDKKENKIEEHKQLLPRILLSADKFGKRLKRNLSPKQKGDWKDLTLMSLSFAVYVYISQQIVCAYCTWMAMPKQPW